MLTTAGAVNLAIPRSRKQVARFRAGTVRDRPELGPRSGTGSLPRVQPNHVALGVVDQEMKPYSPMDSLGFSTRPPSFFTLASSTAKSSQVK